jgi:uncharacterized protein YjbI with pentapeptide repeats
MVLGLFVIGQPDMAAATSACKVVRRDTPKLFKRLFTGSCNQHQSAIFAEELLRAIGEGRSIDVRGAHIVGDLDFTLFHIPRHVVSGREVRLVNGDLRFEDSTFHGLIKTGKGVPVLFTNEVSFINSIFNLSVDFENAIFTRGLTFDRSMFFSDANFKAIQVRGNTSFFTTRFNHKDSHLLFDGARFDGDLLFHNATVETASQFIGTKVIGEGRFQRAKFRSTLDFGPLGEVTSMFYGKVDFSWAELQSPNFFKTEFRDDVIFAEAKLLGSEVNFESAFFAKDVRFESKSLPKKVILRKAEFRGLLDFRGSPMASVDIMEVSKETRIAAIRLDWDTWYESAIWFWLPLVSPSPTILEGGRGGNSLTNDRGDIIRLYKTIEKGLKEQGDVAVANEVYYRRKLLERSEKSPAKKAWEWLVPDLILGYTVRIARPFWALILTWLVSACLFKLGVIMRKETPEWSLRLASLPLRFYQGAVPDGFRRAGVGWRMILSAVILMKFSVGGKYLTNSRLCLILAKTEWFFGVVLISALLTCVIQNFPEIERLLRSTIG